MLFSFRLARIKAEARRRREEREKNESLKAAERVARMKLLMDQFSEWCENPNGAVELQLVSIVFLISMFSFQTWLMLIKEIF